MMEIADDQDLFDTLKTKLFTSVIGDVLDQMGYRRQFLPPAIKPLHTNMKIAGRAMPVLEADVFNDHIADSAGPLADMPFGLMLQALDDLKPGEVYVATGASFNYALWGEIMSTRAQHLKAAGAVLNGFVRDTTGIETLGFSTFSRGAYAQDQGSRGKVIDFRTSIEIDGVRIEPNALIFGDREGVIVIPHQVEREVVRRSLEKIETESQVDEAIRSGMSAVQAFETFGAI